MESGGRANFYVAIIATIIVLVAGASPPSGDNVVVEVKLESELYLISRNATVNESDKVVQSFKCIITGLSKDELSLFSTGKSSNVIVSTKTGNYSRFQDEFNEEGSQSRPFNVELRVVNDTLVVKGDVLMMRSKDSDLDTIVGSNESLTNCEVIFLDANDSNESSENASNRHSESAPIIISKYDHVVLMNGAPEQVISCTVRSNPPPRMSWLLQDHNESDVIALSRASANRGSSGETVSYLLFPHVDKSNRGNYTCVAENEHGRASKTFEVEVISVEAINAHCNDIDESSTPRGHHEVIFNQNIQDILHRSKRHLWYQWRSKKIYVPPFNRPFDPPTSSGEGHNSDLQKMVNLCAQRLLLADKVAVNKWDNDKPVEDIPREQIILKNMVRLAENRGLSPDWANRFFRDQIEGNKDIQYELIRIWGLQGLRPIGPPVDLGNEVRPQIDSINNKLIDLAKYTENERYGRRCITDVEKNARYTVFLYNLDPLHQKALQRATENICISIAHISREPFPEHRYPPPDQFP